MDNVSSTAVDDQLAPDEDDSTSMRPAAGLRADAFDRMAKTLSQPPSRPAPSSTAKPAISGLYVTEFDRRAFARCT
ncbi:hypothetical protein [Caldimonas sp. KR1-144]|uniref:hypothetical protein n=1 Tax=Caldimonas sp. KR1-144 TaxID=3400911 RepID=UPI003C0CC208